MAEQFRVAVNVNVSSSFGIATELVHISRVKTKLLRSG